MRNLLNRFSPASVSARLRSSVRDQVNRDFDERFRHIEARLDQPKDVVAGNDILGALYWPPRYQLASTGTLATSQPTLSDRSNGSSLPLPPVDLRMGHSADDAEFSRSGEVTANLIRQVAARGGIDLEHGASVMDWGCASARVLRHFAAEAENGDFWGVDTLGPAIVWNKANLSPPFRFLTCTSYPHLPFEDNKFNLIFGLSVFTHVFHLMDMWIMELRRILAPGGYGLFTIHDEHTWRRLAEDGELRRIWLKNGWWADENFETGLQEDVQYFGEMGDWSRVVSAFKSDWVAREWGHYMEVVGIEPTWGGGYQSVVILRKST